MFQRRGAKNWIPACLRDLGMTKVGGDEDLREYEVLCCWKSKEMYTGRVVDIDLKLWTSIRYCILSATEFRQLGLIKSRARFNESSKYFLMRFKLYICQFRVRHKLVTWSDIFISPSNTTPRSLIVEEMGMFWSPIEKDWFLRRFRWLCDPAMKNSVLLEFNFARKGDNWFQIRIKSRKQYTKFRQLGLIKSRKRYNESSSFSNN